MSYALLIGINYIGQRAELNGCINDANNLRDLLTSQFKIDKDNITMLTDDTTDPNLKPTRINIIKHFASLAVLAARGQINKLFISYSGHGTYRLDENNDENDGRDEIICPVDYLSEGIISDDALNLILKIIPSTCYVFALFDCCYSGTILDLRNKYMYSDSSFLIKEYGASQLQAPVVLISGSRDDQVSFDVYISGSYTGAMTHAFLYTLKEVGYKITYFDLIKKMRRYLIKNKLTQIPQLTSSHRLYNTNIFCRPKVEDASVFIEY